MSSGIVFQLGVDTLAAGALYALVALAVSLAYSGSGVFDLAIGAVGLAGGLLAASLFSGGMPLVPAALAGLAVGGALSGVAERALVAPVVGKPLLGMTILVAVAVLAQGVLSGLFPRPAYAFPTASGVYTVAGGIVHQYDLVTLAAVVVVAGVSVPVVKSRALGATTFDCHVPPPGREARSEHRLRAHHQFRGRRGAGDWRGAARLRPVSPRCRRCSRPDPPWDCRCRSWAYGLAHPDRRGSAPDRGG